VVKKLDTLTLAVAGHLLQVEHAGPLANEDAQVERARVQHDAGVFIDVDIAEGARLLVHRVFVAGDAFGVTHFFQRVQQFAHGGTQRGGLMPDAGGGQFGFADAD